MESITCGGFARVAGHPIPYEFGVLARHKTPRSARGGGGGGGGGALCNHPMMEPALIASIVAYHILCGKAIFFFGPAPFASFVASRGGGACEVGSRRKGRPRISAPPGAGGCSWSQGGGVTGGSCVVADDRLFGLAADPKKSQTAVSKHRWLRQIAWIIVPNIIRGEDELDVVMVHSEGWR